MTAPSLPAGWPTDRPLAIAVNVMLEGWTDDSAPGIGPMGNPLRAGVLDLQARSWAEYGPKTGAWRLLDLFVTLQVRAVWYVSGIVAERYPDLMRAITAQGHAVAAHGWAQNILPAYQSAAEEEADLPRCTPSPRTSAFLAASGYRWHADIFDADLPYMLPTASGPIVAMPFTMEVNDMPLYVRYGSEPSAFSRIFERIVSNWSAIGAPPGCLDLTVHAHVFGRPYGLVELRQAIEAARNNTSAWLTDHERLAQLWIVRPSG